MSLSLTAGCSRIFAMYFAQQAADRIAISFNQLSKPATCSYRWPVPRSSTTWIGRERERSNTAIHGCMAQNATCCLQGFCTQSLGCRVQAVVLLIRHGRPAYTATSANELTGVPAGCTTQTNRYGCNTGVIATRRINLVVHHHGGSIPLAT